MNNNKLSKRTEESLIIEIEYYQTVQRRHHSITPMWSYASDKLKPLFNEMKSRQRYVYHFGE